MIGALSMPRVNQRTLAGASERGDRGLEAKSRECVGEFHPCMLVHAAANVVGISSTCGIQFVRIGR